MGGLGAPPLPPPPSFARSRSLCSHPRPLSPFPMGALPRAPMLWRAALAGCFGGGSFALTSMVGPSLSAARPTGGRTFVRAPLGLLSVIALLSRYA